MHRRDQKEVLRIIDICAMSTIDERIQENLDTKGSLVSDFKRYLRNSSLVSWFLADKAFYDK